MKRINELTDYQHHFERKRFDAVQDLIKDDRQLLAEIITPLTSQNGSEKMVIRKIKIEQNF